MDKIKKKKNNDKLILGVVCIALIMIVLALTIIDENITHNNNTNEKEHITIKEFSFQRDGLPLNETLYGWIDAKDSLGQEHTYYLTKEQMTGIYLASNKTFEFSDGLDVTYHKTEDLGNIIVDHIYLPNGIEIKPIGGKIADMFTNNSVTIGKTSKYCDEYFGLTMEEFLDAP